MSARSGQTIHSDKERFFVQAPIPALREDGLRVFVTGTVLASLFTVVAFVMKDQLVSAGHGWLVWVGVSCIIIGLGGATYCWARRRRRTTTS